MAKLENMQHTCDVCGRKMFRKIKSHGYTLCDKHYNQLRKYGKFLDNNPRTQQDRNHFEIKGNIAIIDIYDKDCNKIAETIVDAEDIDRVKNIKWKLSASGYAMNTPKNKPNKHLSRLILGVDTFVDHINGNTLDNRKCNLRVATKSQNQMNVNYRGVDKQKNGTYKARIKLHGKAYYLGTYLTEEEALYARFYAETIMFKDYQYNKPEPDIGERRKKEIREYVNKKVQRL